MINIYSPYEIDVEKFSSDPRVWEIFANKFMNSLDNIKNLMLLTAPGYSWILAQTYDFSDLQSADLSRIIRDILFGDLFIGDMVVTISQKLNIDLQTAQQMSSKIINELFAPAIEDIKKMQREKFPDRVGQGGASATRPTMPQPPPPPQMKNAPPINQGNVIDLRVNSNS